MISSKMQLQSIVDSAALAATIPDGASEGERIALATEVIDTHTAKRRNFNIKDQTVLVHGDGSEVEVSLLAEVPSLFGSLLKSGSRQIGVSALAQESTSGSINPLSISVVLDTSPSMSERFDTGSRIAAVKLAMNNTFDMIENRYGGEVAAATQFSTGLYPYNWGLVDGAMAPLESGTEAFDDAIAFLPLNRGSVPPEAFERALEDQIDAIRTEGERDRYIVFLTGSTVDIDHADTSNSFLHESEIYLADGTPECEVATSDLVQAKRDLSATFDYMHRNSQTLRPHAARHGVEYSTSEAGLEAHGREASMRIISNGCVSNCQRIGRDFTAYLDAITQRNLVCRPRQIDRVAEACERARDNDISVVAINLATDSWQTQDLIDLCVNPDTVSERVAENRELQNITRPDPLGRTLSPPIRTLPGGLRVQLSVDGESMSATVDNLEDLNDVLANIMPEAERGVRSVRLVR